MLKSKTLVLGLEHFIDKIGYQSIVYKKNGISVRYLVLDKSGYTKEKVNKYDADVIIVPKNLILRILITIWNMIVFRPQDVEIYDIGRTTFIYILLAKIFNIKSIIILRGRELECNQGIRKFGLIKSLELCNHIIAKEYNIIENLKKININTNKLSFIYNSVPIPSSDKLYNFKDREIDIIYINSIRKSRNVHILIDVFYELMKELPNLNIFLVGFTSFDKNNYSMEPKYEKYVLDLIKKRDLEDKIKLKGFVSDPTKYQKNSKIFVFPSNKVFLNYSLLESMSYGVIPIVGDGEGADKIIKNDYNGYISKINKNDFKKTLLKVLKNDNNYNNKISMRAYYTVQNKYSIKQWGDKMINIKENI